MTDLLYTTPAKVIKEYLITNNYFDAPALAAVWPLYTGHLPDENKDSACLYDSPGLLDGTVLSTGETIEHFGIQLHIRSKEYDDGWLKANEVVVFLETVFSQEVEIDSVSYRIENVYRTSSVNYIGTDEKRRFEFSVNFRTDVKPV